MPWKECSAVSLREELVRLAQMPGANIALLCRRFGISRRCASKWIGRFEQGGAEALADRSRRPHHSPGRSSGDLEQQVIAARQSYPAWGPRKLRRVLLNQQTLNRRSVPAPSTIGQILLRHGLISEAESAQHQPLVRFQKQQPNELWQMDYKGHVALLDGQRCHPLTILDDHSRYNLCLRACGDERTQTVQAVLIDTFERYGQPHAILCDNGSPWGSGGGERYTLLSVWLLRHGIGVRHGRPYHPQTQGKDERYHRTLGVELLNRETLPDLEHAQTRFDAFRQQYNQLRPHEALQLDCPVQHYRCSPRSYQADPPSPEYQLGDELRKGDAAGTVSYRGWRLKIGKAFVGQSVGLRAETTVDGVMQVIFACQQIGQVDLRGAKDGTCRRMTEGRCGAEPAVATLPAAQHRTEEMGNVSPMSPNRCHP